MAFAVQYGLGEGDVPADQLWTLAFMLRIFVNDPDSVCALLALA